MTMLLMSRRRMLFVHLCLTTVSVSVMRSERQTHLLVRIGGGMGTKSLGSWTGNSFGKYYEEARRAPSERLADFENKDANNDPRCEGRWNPRWGPDGKETDGPHDKWTDSGKDDNETWIGEDGFSDVYKGQSSKSWKHCTSAIKRLNRKGAHGKEEFRNELDLIFKLHHQNNINFLSYCDVDNEMIIVNEYGLNGSLDGYLEDGNKRRNLTLVHRLRIWHQVMCTQVLRMPAQVTRKCKR
nr:protein kinase, ATP binding site-containing protein [Tanacetum cinerariifolium]